VDIWEILILFIIVVAILVALYKSFVILRPTSRGLVERLGRYNRLVGQGFHPIIPLVEKVVRVNITEQLVTAEPQQIITKDKLNATVDAQIYFKVKDDEESIKASQYNVFNYTIQIVQLARTTLRNIIGTLTLTEANSQRDRINLELMNTLATETKNWGINVVRTELKEIDPPKDVQQTMNEVVKAENTKIAAIDFATARETEADGMRRAAIKKAEGERAAAILSAEGERQAKILKAEGDAQAIKLVNQAAQQYFVGAAQDLRKIQAAETSFGSGTMKLVVPEGVPLVNVFSEAAGVTPVVLKPEMLEKKRSEDKNV
jgi:regulator of protease activity HflC (stomatin/prohibitin superfamily)